MSATGWLGIYFACFFYFLFSRHYDLRMDDKWDWTTETAYNHGVWVIDDRAGAQILSEEMTEPVNFIS